jgi:hypothetical protein
MCLVMKGSPVRVRPSASLRRAGNAEPRATRSRQPETSTSRPPDVGSLSGKRFVASGIVVSGGRCDDYRPTSRAGLMVATSRSRSSWMVSKTSFFRAHGAADPEDMLKAVGRHREAAALALDLDVDAVCHLIGSPLRRTP